MILPGRLRKFVSATCDLGTGVLLVLLFNALLFGNERGDEYDYPGRTTLGCGK